MSLQADLDNWEKSIKGKWIKSPKWFDHHEAIKFITWLKDTQFVKGSEQGCFFIGEYADGSTSEFKFSNVFTWREV